MDNETTILEVLREISESGASSSPLLLCFCAGGSLPEYCAPMPRDPAPQTGQIFDSGFRHVLSEAIMLNPEVHDGAIVFLRSASGRYHVAGWSFRLFPPEPRAPRPSNRGAAFNSCLAMSQVGRVEVIYVLSHGEVHSFRNGVVQRHEHRPR